MRRIIYLCSILSIGFIISCKEKAKETEVPVQADSLSVEEKKTEVEPESDGFKAHVTNSDFDKIQKLIQTQSDTVYITNYWATWCGPCVDEIPDFVSLQNEYKDKKVKFTFVSVDDITVQQTEVIPFIQKYKMNNVYQISMEDLIAKIGTIDPKLAGGIPVTVIQKGENREGFMGSRPKAFMAEKIEEYLSKK